MVQGKIIWYAGLPQSIDRESTPGTLYEQNGLTGTTNWRKVQFLTDLLGVTRDPRKAVTKRELVELESLYLQRLVTGNLPKSDWD